MNAKKDVTEMYGRESFLNPPLLEIFTKKRWWTTFEAAWVLTEWPEYDTVASYIPDIPLKIREDRDLFYLPMGGELINLEFYGDDFKRVYSKLIFDISQKKIKAESIPIFNGINHLLNPIDIIFWAFKSDLRLPQELQSAFGIEMRKERQQVPWKRKVKTITIGQYYKEMHPTANLSDVVDSEWMKIFKIEIHSENQKKQLRNDLKLVFDPGKPGRPCKQQDDLIPLNYSIRKIAQVLETTDTITIFNFDLLKIVIETAVSLVFDMIQGLNHFEKLSLSECLEQVLEDPLIKKYRDKSPPIIEHLIREFAGAKIGEYQELFHLATIVNSSNQLPSIYTLRE